ncbi:MAG: CDP-6-deoxy-delta-3,4-glucoseen reductase [Gammaproteobacteria bacterium]|nr:MAG: CDP-6-deoxy-delta-3,4-glucoseen reductase [Gammaproteobacteria bacterium]
MSYKITLQPSEKTFAAEVGEFIVDAAHRQGIPLPYSCRDGTCGTCKGKVLSGEVKHDHYSSQALSDDERKDGRALFCQAQACSDLVLELDLGNSAVQRLPSRVDQIDNLAHDVMRLFLKLPTGKKLNYIAGQYIDIIMSDGRHRTYSIANAPRDDGMIELHIRNVEGGRFSDFAFHHLEQKTILRIEGPMGAFYLRQDSTRPLLLVAGGTGLAPIKAIIEAAQQAGDKRKTLLYWGVRSKRDLYFEETVKQWAEAEHITYVPVLSEPDADWQGRSGYVHEAVLKDIADFSQYDVYAAGPPIMVSSARNSFLEAGLPEAQIFHDAFEWALDTQAAIKKD